MSFEVASQSRSSPNGSGNEAAGTGGMDFALQWCRTVLLKRWPVILLLVGLSGGIGYGLSRFPQVVQQDWRAEGSVALIESVASPEIRDYLPLQDNQVKLRTNSLLFEHPDVLDEFCKEFDIEIPIKVISDNLIKAEPEPGTHIIKVYFEWGDPKLAAQMLNRLMGLFNEKVNKDRKRTIHENIEKSGLLETIENAKVKNDRAKADLQAFRQKHGLTDLPSDIKNLSDTMERAQLVITEAKRENSKIQQTLSQNEGKRSEAIIAGKNRLGIDTLRANADKLRFELDMADKQVARDYLLYSRRTIARFLYEETLNKRDKTKTDYLAVTKRSIESEAQYKHLQITEAEHPDPSLEGDLKHFEYQLQEVTFQQKEFELSSELVDQQKMVQAKESLLRINRISKAEYDEHVRRRDRIKSELAQIRNQLAQTRKTLDRVKAKALLPEDLPPLKLTSLELSALIPLDKDRKDLKARQEELRPKIARETKNYEDSKKRKSLLIGLQQEYADLTKAVSTAYAEHKAKVRESELLRALQNKDVDEYVVTRAPIPNEPWGRKKLKFIAMVLAAGTVLTLGGVFGYEWLTGTGSSGEEVAVRLGLPIIARPTVSRNLAAILADLDHQDRELQTLALRIRQMIQKPGCVILGTSLQQHVESNQLLVPLAGCFARRDERVVIVDVCMDSESREQDFTPLLDRARSNRHHRDASEASKYASPTGLADFLANETMTVDQIVQTTKIPNVDYIPMGLETLHSGYLATHRMDGLIELLSKRYSMVLLAGPLATHSMEVEILTARADGVLLVASPSEGMLGEGKLLIEKLAAIGAPIIGVASVSITEQGEARAVVRKPGKARWKESEPRRNSANLQETGSRS